MSPREGRLPLMIALDREQEFVMKTFTFVRTYGRYVLSALAALAFGVDAQ